MKSFYWKFALVAGGITLITAAGVIGTQLISRNSISAISNGTALYSSSDPSICVENCVPDGGHAYVAAMISLRER